VRIHNHTLRVRYVRQSTAPSTWTNSAGKRTAATKNDQLPSLCCWPETDNSPVSCKIWYEHGQTWKGEPEQYR